jgi:hypothetical protein
MQKESLRDRGGLPIPTTAPRRRHLDGHWQLESAWILEGVDYSTTSTDFYYRAQTDKAQQSTESQAHNQWQHKREGRGQTIPKKTIL